MPKYSIWELEHESENTVRAYKVKDTNSNAEVEKAMRKHYVASFYREEEELNAMYLQTFSEE